MEEIMDSSNTINNNVIDDLEVLKESQLNNTLENVKMVNQVDNKIDNATDNQSKDQDNQPEGQDKLTPENLLDSNGIQSKNEDQLIGDLLNNDNQNETNQESNVFNLDENKETNDKSVEQETGQEESIKQETKTEENEEEMSKPNLSDETTELVKNLIDDQPTNTTEQVNDLVSDLIEPPKSDELSESIKELIDDLNVTADPDRLSSTNNENDLLANVEDSIEQPRDSAMISVLNDNLIEDCSVKETQFIDLTQDTTQNTLDSSQNDTNQDEQNFTTTTELNETIHENLLEQPALTENDSKQENDHLKLDLDQSSEQATDKPIDELIIASESQSSKEINLIDISEDSLIKEQENQKPLNTTLDQDNQTQQLDQENSSGQLKTEKSDFFSDLNKELNKSVEAFLTDIKPNEPVHQEPTSEQKTLEDFVTKDVENEEKVEDKSDLLAKSDTFIVHKSDDLSKEENSQSNKEEPVKNDPIKNDQVRREDSVNLEEVIRTTKTEVFNQSQKFLEKADKLIAEKKNQLTEVNIPGLDIKSAAEQSQDSQKDLKSDESTNQESSSQNKSAENVPTKSKPKSRNCILM